MEINKKQSFLTELIICIVLLVLLFPIGLIVTSIFAKEAKRYPKANYARTIIRLNSVAFYLILLIAVALIAFLSIGMFDLIW